MDFLLKQFSKQQCSTVGTLQYTVPCCSHVQMLPNKSTVQTPVHLGVFSHYVTRMVYSPPFPPPANIYIYQRRSCREGRKRDRKERGRTHEKTTFVLLLSLQFVTTKWHDISLNHVKYIPLGGSSIYMREDQPAVQYCRTNDRRKGGPKILILHLT